MEIKLENTAIRNGISKSVIDYIDTKENLNILDYGFGKLRNSKYLKKLGHNVSVLDTPTQIEKNKKELHEFKVYSTESIPNEKFDIVLCTFVLNVIPDLQIRNEIVSNLILLVKDTGKIIIEVRRDKGILKNKHMEKYKDGYIVGKNKIKTFQKPFTVNELEEIFKNNFNNVELKTIKNYPDSIVAIINKIDKGSKSIT